MSCWVGLVRRGWREKVVVRQEGIGQMSGVDSSASFIFGWGSVGWLGCGVLLGMGRMKRRDMVPMLWSWDDVEMDDRCICGRRWVGLTRQRSVSRTLSHCLIGLCFGHGCKLCLERSQCTLTKKEEGKRLYRKCLRFSHLRPRRSVAICVPHVQALSIILPPALRAITQPLSYSELNNTLSLIPLSHFPTQRPLLNPPPLLRSPGSRVLNQQ